MASQATAEIPQSSGQPLSAAIRNTIARDEDLRRLADELKRHVYRGIEWWDSDRRASANRRLANLTPSLPRLVEPAAYSVDKVATAFATDPRTALLASFRSQH